MAEFFDFLQAAIGAPTPKLFIVFGLLFLGVAIVGSSTGRMQPGRVGRALGGVLGPLLIAGGLMMDLQPIVPSVAPAAQPVVVRSTVVTSGPSEGGKGMPLPTATSLPPRSTPLPTVTPERRTPVPTATPVPVRNPLLDPINTKADAANVSIADPAARVAHDARERLL